MTQSQAERTEYMREYRKKNPTQVQLNKLRINARARALESLAELYPGNFNALYDYERSTVGLPPLGNNTVGRPGGK